MYIYSDPPEPGQTKVTIRIRAGAQALAVFKALEAQKKAIYIEQAFMLANGETMGYIEAEDELMWLDETLDNLISDTIGLLANTTSTNKEIKDENEKFDARVDKLGRKLRKLLRHRTPPKTGST